MKSVMYHYVREASTDRPHFRYLHIDNFRKQLDYFTQNFYLPERDEFLDCVKAKRCIENSLVLTFDDGLRDHAEYVLPELHSRNLWGIFYVPTGPLTTGKALNVHVIHQLLGAYGGTIILEALTRLVQANMLKHAHVEEFQQLTYPDQEDDLEATTLTKRILNYFLAIEWQGRILDQLVADFPILTTEELYLSTSEITDIHSCGHIIGSHSVNHPLFSKLSFEQQKSEILDSFAFLEGVLGTSSAKTFCYPYGGVHSFTPQTEKILADAGCAFSFNVEYRDIDPTDLSDRPQALPRYDCNLFPHGKAS